MSVFYEENINKGVRKLSSDESRHCVQVLRHQSGDEILILDGNGGKHHAILDQVSKNSCTFEVKRSEKTPPKSFSIHLAITPTKNADRMEWLIEKLSEVGVDEITFIQTSHSERKKQRLDRLEKKAISAMKQSGNPFKLKINEMITLETFLKSNDTDQRFIAHVDPSHPYLAEVAKPKSASTILIGPEGDFSQEELRLATNNEFKPVSLGTNTLRTETAGFVACCSINTINSY